MHMGAKKNSHLAQLLERQKDNCLQIIYLSFSLRQLYCNSNGLNAYSFIYNAQIMSYKYILSLVEI